MNSKRIAKPDESDIQSYGAASPSEWSATTVPSASGSPP